MKYVSPCPVCGAVGHELEVLGGGTLVMRIVVCPKLKENDEIPIYMGEVVVQNRLDWEKSVPGSVYIQAVKGRQDFREAFRKEQVKSARFQRALELISNHRKDTIMHLSSDYMDGAHEAFGRQADVADEALEGWK